MKTRGKTGVGAHGREEEGRRSRRAGREGEGLRQVGWAEVAGKRKKKKRKKGREKVVGRVGRKKGKERKKERKKRKKENGGRRKEGS